MTTRTETTDKESHDFIALHDDEVPWTSGPEANELLTLPDGVEVKIFAYDPVMKRVDMKVKFPPGYVEPAHSHKSWHSIMVLKGRMCVAGKDLRPGDYVFGWDLPHGPYEYPDGCEVFTVFMGEGTQHEWDEAVHLAHETTWEAETEAGKQGVEAHAVARKAGRSSAAE